MYNTAMELEIKSSKYCCNACNKKYTKKSSLDNHKILCDFKLKTTREQQIEIEEIGDMPSHAQLVKIVQELTLKLIKMEEKMEEMQKFVDKKKKKINIATWLNANIIPSVGFNEWVNNYIIVMPEHFENLIENTLFHTIQQIFEFNLTHRENFVSPICCFTQKPGVFYIGDKKEDGTAEWRPLALEDMVLLLRIIQNRVIRELTKWKMDNQHKFNDNDKISTLFNKAVIKLMNISFTPDATMSRIKNGMFNYLKTDLKNMIEYEFE
jgi:hypothetical protein